MTAHPVLVRVTAPRCCAGAVTDRRGRIVRTAPILRRTRGWTLDRLRRHCRRRGWQLEVLDRPTRTDP